MTPTPAYPRRRAAGLRDERGIALVTSLIIMSVILFLGTFALMSSRSEIRTSANYRGRIQAQYFAESGIDLAVGWQNDLTNVPRYLFDPKNYSFTSADSFVFKDMNAIDPESGKSIGTIHRVIFGNPAAQPPPYRMSSTATLRDGSEATYEVEVNALSLLDFAMYAEGSISYITPGMWLGRTYVNGNISIFGNCATPEVFMKRVEYTGTLSGVSCGNFREGSAKIPAYPPLTALVDLDFFEDAAEDAGVCGSGIGLHIGTKGGVPNTVRDQSKDIFGLKDTVKPGVDDLTKSSDWDNSEGEAVTGCMDTGGNECFQIDFTLFDFTADPVTYGGVELVGGDGNKLGSEEFNGVIFVEGELHVWGILGGRSPEDRTVADTINAYDLALKRPKSHPTGWLNPPTESLALAPKGRPFHHHPKFDELEAPWNAMAANLYSNNALDAGEDANANGILDPAGLGRSLTVVTDKDSDIVIDHNIHYGTDSTGNRVTLGLLAGDAVYVDMNSPRGFVATGAILARGSDSFSGWKGSFIALPNNDQDTHRQNWWAKAGGDSDPADSTYAYDLSGNGVLEVDMGQGLAGDRNETSMRDAWANLDLGNLVTSAGASWGPWVTTPHAGTKIYDFEMQSAEPPCWPVLPYYGTVSGSFTEVRN